MIILYIHSLALRRPCTPFLRSGNDYDADEVYDFLDFPFASSDDHKSDGQTELPDHTQNAGDQEEFFVANIAYCIRSICARPLTFHRLK